MNIAEASIRNKTITFVFAFLLMALGIVAYLNLPRLEDPEFTIKDALIVTNYPGASAEEVQKEVSDVIELAAQQLEQLERVVSRSERGRSTVTVTIRDKYDRHSLPQVWDELRRKVGDAQRRLPPCAGPSVVLDDFGDVFGIFFALTGPDYTDAQLYDTAKLLRRELLLVNDVKKIEFFGHQQEAREGCGSVGQEGFAGKAGGRAVLGLAHPAPRRHGRRGRRGHGLDRRQRIQLQRRQWQRPQR